ncbi:MAG: c-type cytochrome [Boseongicola sp.]
MIRTLFAALLTASGAIAEPNPDNGMEVYLNYCAACHGAGAKGDGPMVKLLKAIPADLTVLAEANDGVFPTFRIVRQIDGRDPLLSHGGEMPLFGHLFSYPDGSIAAETGQPIITAQPIADVAAWLQSIQE